MTPSKELLSKISALRVRLDRIQSATGDSRASETPQGPHYSSPPPPPPVRLTARAAQLLHEARGLLVDLRALADDPVLTSHAPAQALERDAARMLELAMHTLLGLPAEAAAQLRQCEGVDSCLVAVRDILRRLHVTIDLRRREEQTIGELSELLGRLSLGQHVELRSFLALARGIAEEATACAPLRRPGEAPRDGVRLAAQQGLFTARVLAWVLRGEQRHRLAEVLVPALIHDVGMILVPAEIIRKTEPLTDAEREIVKRHCVHGRDAALRLYPGGGWPVDAVADHHERVDGSGYPHGKRAGDLGDLARLLAACDVYAALGSPRSHRRGADPRTALADTLALAEAGTLERAQCEKLLRLTFYPAGTVVQLSSGTVALVVGTPRAMVNPSKAIVIPLCGPSGELPPHPWPVDLAESSDLDIVRSLTPAERAHALGRTHPALV